MIIFQLEYTLCLPQNMYRTITLQSITTDTNRTDLTGEPQTLAVL